MMLTLTDMPSLASSNTNSTSNQNEQIKCLDNLNLFLRKHFYLFPLSSQFFYNFNFTSIQIKITALFYLPCIVLCAERDDSWAGYWIIAEWIVGLLIELLKWNVCWLWNECSLCLWSLRCNINDTLE